VNASHPPALIVVERAIRVAWEGSVDRHLVDEAQQGGRDAFTELMRLEGGRLYALAYRILRDRQLAQDAFQEAALAAWRRLPTLRDADRFEAWMQRVLVHACYAESRKRTRWTATVRLLEVDSSGAMESRSAIYDRDELERAFRKLSIDHRAVFVMHHYVGLPLVEVAERLGIPAGTARSRLHYATEALRQAITDDNTLAVEERLA
jgi:RNA polymerase sigma-70 factor (ECF subfamily)